MAFCTACGADVTGKNFCMSCGKPVGGGQPASGAPQSSAAAPQPAAQAGPPPPTQSQPPQPGPPPGYAPPPGPPPMQQPMYGAPPYQGPPMQAGPKKTSPVLWIVLGVLGFFVLVGLVITIGIGMFVHKVKQNPAMAVAKLLTAANPDVEVLDADEGRNSVKLRDKKTGETITVNLDDLKNGRINLRGPKGERATINAHGDGQNGSLEINGPQGSMKFGAGANAKMPDWVPVYPGATPTANFSMQGGDGSGGSFAYTTKDSMENVAAFYNRTLTGSGFKINATVNGASNGASGTMLSAENETSKQTVVVTIGTENSVTAINIIYGTKK